MEFLQECIFYSLYNLKSASMNVTMNINYPCSFGWLSPATFPPFFRTYVAPGEFSRASTSTFRDMLSDEGKCLLRLGQSRSSGTINIRTCLPTGLRRSKNAGFLLIKQKQFLKIFYRRNQQVIRSITNHTLWKETLRKES